MLANPIFSWNEFSVIESDVLDGHKYYFENDNWLLIRTSGTEPVLRIYAQGKDIHEVDKILSAARMVLNV
jgi:phosphomannomutase